jgi:serine/threonine-protein kinase
VTVYDVGLAMLDGRPEVFIAMELVEGGTLEGWLRARPRDWHEIVAMFAQAGRGLAAAHETGIVHRDFKPANVLVTRDGEAKVSDFGLATSGEPPPDASDATTDGDVRAGSGSLTRTGTVMGTPMYMAPEQRAGAKVDARADLYAFCVALFNAVAGVPPFGKTAGEIERRSQARELSTPVRRMPPALLRVLRAGLDPDPAARPASMRDVLAVLDGLGARRSWGVVGAAAALAAAGLAAGGWWM